MNDRVFMKLDPTLLLAASSSAHALSTPITTCLYSALCHILFCMLILLAGIGRTEVCHVGREEEPAVNLSPQHPCSFFP
jgi:hypothetical protein